MISSLKCLLSLKLQCSPFSDGDKKPRKRTYEQIKVDENENCSSLGSPSEPPQVEVFLCWGSYITVNSCGHQALLILMFYFCKLIFIIILIIRKKLYDYLLFSDDRLLMFNVVCCILGNYILHRKRISDC